MADDSRAIGTSMHRGGGPLKRTTRALVSIAATAFVVLVGCEIFARLATGLDPDSAAAERSSFLARLPGRAAQDDARRARRSVDMAYGARYELHPFFGYTFYRNWDGANNQGFMTGGVDFPYRRGPREVVVGLFGGSVAMQLAGRPQSLTEPIAHELAARGYERVTLLSFAVGGWRQPQSFYAFVYFLSTIDIAINVDGFNESIPLGAVGLTGYPAAFPFADIYGALATTSDDRYGDATSALLIALNESVATATRAVGREPLRRSALAHMAWRVLANRYAASTTELRTRQRNDIASQFRGIDSISDPMDVAGTVDAYHRLYGDLVRYSDSIAKREAKLFFHFVQPNQYDRGAKPLSDEERRQHTSNDWFDTVTAEYDRLETISEALAKEGIASHSLADVFLDVRETMYADACCHLNERGVEMLNREITGRILASGRLDDLPPAPGRESTYAERFADDVSDGPRAAASRTSPARSRGPDPREGRRARPGGRPAA